MHLLLNGVLHHFGDWDLLIRLKEVELYLLHDGRATSIEQAILFHSGENKVSVDRFTKLNTQKTMLLTFLKSL